LFNQEWIRLAQFKYLENQSKQNHVNHPGWMSFVSYPTLLLSGVKNYHYLDINSWMGMVSILCTFVKANLWSAKPTSPQASSQFTSQKAQLRASFTLSLQTTWTSFDPEWYPTIGARRVSFTRILVKCQLQCPCSVQKALQFGTLFQYKP